MKRKKLAETNPQGRVDVLLYRLAERYMGHVETEKGLVGLRQHLLPDIEKVIRRNVRGQNVIPQELRGMLAAIEENLKTRR